MKKQLQKAKEKFDNSRLSNRTTPPFWRKIRNISGGIAVAGTLALSAPISIPAGIVSWISYIVLVTGTISGSAHLTKKK